MSRSDRGSRIPGSAIAGRLLGLVVVLTVAAGSGAVIGIANAMDATPAPPVQDQLTAPSEEPELFQATLAVQEAPVNPATGAPLPAGNSGGARQNIAAPVVDLKIPALAGASAGAATSGRSAVKCSRFDDAKINWLLEQVANTKAENPALSQGADKLTAELRALLGKNLCASEAQAIIKRLCGDPAVVKVMNAMVNRMPFFLKPMVGDPCRADLVEVLNKVGRFVPGLSSDPS